MDSSSITSFFPTLTGSAPPYASGFSSSASGAASSAYPVPTSGNGLPVPGNDGGIVANRHPVLYFFLGLIIVTGASLMNALGLNVTKLSHIHALSETVKRPDYLRPLWLLGMTLYIISQAFGSTLALNYLRSEFVAPLGSTSLIFNVLFASWLVGVQVTRADYYGTGLIILGVILILVFASINSGLSTSISLERLYSLWGRGGFLTYFFIQVALLAVAWNCVYSISTISSIRSSTSTLPGSPTPPPADAKFRAKISYWHKKTIGILTHRLDKLTEALSDERLSWIEGVGWACLGGLLAGGSLVFAKACVKLAFNPEGGQFAHPTSILTVVLLVITSILQMVALNRGLKAFDSTLVVPYFYALYTSMGFINSMIFLNEVAAYSSWILFLIFLSICVLLSGVVLLSTKKPDPLEQKETDEDDMIEGELGEDGDDDIPPNSATPLSKGHQKSGSAPGMVRRKSKSNSISGNEEQESLVASNAEAEDGKGGDSNDGYSGFETGNTMERRESEVMWEVGSDESEDESDALVSVPKKAPSIRSEVNVWREDDEER